MKTTSGDMMARAYETYRDRVVAYINCRINDEENARDMTQDVFVRMLEYSHVIYENAIENFIYTIARNMVNDYLRRVYVRREYDRYAHDYMSDNDSSLEHNVIASDLARYENMLVSQMPTQRATVYRLKRFDEMSAKEISERLGLSVRTVENHYYAGLKHVKEKLSQVI